MEFELPDPDDRLFLFYPTPFVHRPGALWPTAAPGPFDVVVADSETTAMVRDAHGHVWVIDLPQAAIVQITAPVREESRLPPYAGARCGRAGPDARSGESSTPASDNPRGILLTFQSPTVHLPLTPETRGSAPDR